MRLSLLLALPSLVTCVALVPAKGALLGHYYGTGTIAATIARIGRQPQIHLTYYGWEDHWALSSDTASDFQNGRIPLVNWEPFGVMFQDIVAGKHDALIRQQADEAKGLGKNFFLDFAAEMNEEEGWGNHDPELYIATWRHIHDIFTARGASNVVWVWAPNNVDSDGEPGAMEYYPGDAYVNWVGADGYNWGTRKPGFEWQSFAAVFEDIYSKLVTTGKPIIIGETASAEVGGNKATWIGNIVPTLRTKFPAIKAVVWFDVKKERNWAIDSSKASLAAYRKMAANPYFDLSQSY